MSEARPLISNDPDDAVADQGAATDLPDDYHGRPIRRLANDRLWLDVLASAGPRIVRLGLAGSSANILAETPGVGWDTPYGRYDLIGGHRLWFAPEDPDRVAVPDGHGLDIRDVVDGIELIGATEPQTGLVRSVGIRLLADRPGIELRHELRNVSAGPLELAPWAITQLPLGGTVLLPQPITTPGHHVRPNRMLVLWPYASWEDRRFHPIDGLLTLDAFDGPSFKLGTFNEAGWVAYVRDGIVLVRRFEPQVGRPHPDLGCNVEVFVGGAFAELELLGALARLDPGANASLVEVWELEAVDTTDGELDVDRLRGIAARIERDRAPRLVA